MILEEFGATYLSLKVLLGEASEAQWQAGMTPTPKEDTTERSKGLTSDPTPTVAADARRLALRLAVIEAEQAMEKADRTLRAAERHLTDALERWHNA